MRHPDPNPEALKTLRSGALPTRGIGALLRHQDWMWRKAGLVLALVLAVVIAGLTLTPASGAPTMAGIDKVFHFIALAALIFPLIVTDSRRWRWAVPLAIAYGGAIELIQPMVGRSAEWLDFGADISGVLAGAALAELLHDRIRRSVFDLDTQAEAEAEDEDEAVRLEAMRAALMADMRAVLHEELDSVRRPGNEAAPAPDSASRDAETPAETPGGRGGADRGA